MERRAAEETVHPPPTQPAQHQVQSVQRPVTYDPISNTYFNNPTCFTSVVQHWQVYLNRCATEDTRRLRIAKHNLLMLAFSGDMEVTCKADDIKDFQSKSLQYINPGQHVVATLAIYLDVQFRAGDVYNLLLGELYMGFGELKFMHHQK